MPKSSPLALAVLLLPLTLPTSNTHAQARNDCFKNPLIRVTDTRSEGRISRGTGTLECSIAGVSKDALDKLMRYLEADAVVGLREPARGPFRSAQPTIGQTPFTQSRPDAVAYDIRPTGRQNGKELPLYADGRIYFSRVNLANGSEQGIVSFVTQKMHCNAMGGLHLMCWTHAVNGRTEFVQSPGDPNLSVRSVTEVQVKQAAYVIVGRGSAAKTIEDKLQEEIPLQARERTLESLNDLVAKGILPRP